MKEAYNQSMIKAYSKVISLSRSWNHTQEKRENVGDVLRGMP